MFLEFGFEKDNCLIIRRLTRRIKTKKWNLKPLQEREAASEGLSNFHTMRRKCSFE